jgi:pyrroline-5-carboxylate reductase
VSTPTIAFIGAGNMATAMMTGLIQKGHSPNLLVASNRGSEKLEPLKELGIHTTTDNDKAARHADIVVLAVKPQLMKAVCAQLRDAVSTRQPLIISVAAGISLNCLNAWLGENIAIVRAMPNTPASVGLGITGLIANSKVNLQQQLLADTITNSIGTSVWLKDEKLMDALTAVSGCGPAYFFLMMEAMIDAACELGLSRENAHTLTVQTALGAAHMASQPGADPAALRKQVTSPNGVTEQAILSFEQNGLRMLFRQALTAAVNRSQEIAQSLAKG